MTRSASTHQDIEHESISPEDLSDGKIDQHLGPIVSTPIKIAIAFAIALTLGLLIDQRMSFRKERWDGLLRNSDAIWYHNRTFSQSPTPESERAWNSIIPIGRGFVHHPELAPFISNIAVFHQLHCLHAILVAYYSAVDETAVLREEGRPPDEYLSQTGTRLDPKHIRHCFDYLRQTLICAADTNLEVLDADTHLTNGWGQKRQCRDYDEVFAWAEKWANSTDTGIVT